MILFICIFLLVCIACGCEPWDPSGFSLREFGIGRVKSPERTEPQADVEPRK